MTTLTMLERRLDRLEAQSPTWAGYADLQTPSAEFVRTIIGMLAESGALLPPPPGMTDRWRDLRLALGISDGPAAAEDIGE